jgi:bacterioferritin
MAQSTPGTTEKPFLTDVKALRSQARREMEAGAVTPTYRGDVNQTIALLQSVLATEIVCVLRYTQHSIVASGLASDSVKNEFAEHAREENEHAMWVAERINQLGGSPNFNPEGLVTRSASQYVTPEKMVDMIRENLVAERIAIDHYRELIRYFGENDPTTRSLLEKILAVEEEHADDMASLLAAHAPPSH